MNKNSYLFGLLIVLVMLSISIVSVLAKPAEVSFEPEKFISGSTLFTTPEKDFVTISLETKEVIGLTVQQSEMYDYKGTVANEIDQGTLLTVYGRGEGWAYTDRGFIPLEKLLII